MTTTSTTTTQNSDSEDEYYRDIFGFVRDFKQELKINDDEDAHWSDISWDKDQMDSLGFVGSVSKFFKNMEFEENTHLKITFTSSVLGQIFKVYAVSAGQALLPWYYVITCPILILWRIYSYFKIQYHFFCLDYCYFGNLTVFLILTLAPSNPQLFILQFCVANGLLYTGAFSFRNSLVFHSVDKMTSTYIHSAPVLLAFGIRWFPQEASRFWHTPFPTEFMEWNVRWNVLAPLAFVLTHATFYTILVYGILKPEKHIVTSFRYLKAKGTVKSLIPKPKFYHFVLMEIVIVLFMTGVTIVTYTYYLANLMQVLLLLIAVTWNGAGYYVDVFRMSFGSKEVKKNKTS